MINRRKLITTSIQITAAAPVAFAALNLFGKEPAAKKPGSSKPAQPAGKANLVDPNKDPVAKALKYTHEASKATRTDKMGVSASEQFCKNCQLYTAQGDGAGKCQMIATGLVAADGWCTSWVKKS